MDRYLRIGEVAKKTGLNPKTIRYYEEMGLIPPPRRSEAGSFSAGYRLFTQEDVERLELIKRAKLLDLSLSQIRELLTAVEEGCCTSAQPQLLSVLDIKLREIDMRIQMLVTLRNNLKRLHQNLTEVRPNPRADESCTISTCGWGEKGNLADSGDI